MLYNSRGDYLAGVGGDGRISINGVVPPILASVPAGSWKWLDDDTAMGQGYFRLGWRLLAYHVPTGAIIEMRDRGCSEIHAGGGNWATYTAGIGYEDDRGRVLADGAPLAVATDHYYVTNLNHERFWFYRGTDPVAYLIYPHPVVEAFCREGVLLYQTTLQGVVNADGSTVVTVPGLGVRFTRLPSGEVWLLRWSEQFGVIVHPADEAVGYVVTDASILNYAPDLFAVSDDWLHVIGAQNEAETAGRVVFRALDLRTPRVDFAHPPIDPPVDPIDPPDPPDPPAPAPLDSFLRLRRW